ncbi:MAG: plastocyanin/azurin family copper-binding protein [Pirellulales bacterium]
MIRSARMNGRFYRFSVLVFFGLLGNATTLAQHDHGDHGANKKVEPPKVFLDKSPKIVEYQLKRLTQEQLLLVERKEDHPKYVPVHQAILGRQGMPLEERSNSLRSLATIRKTTLIQEAIATLGGLPESGDASRIARDLAHVIASQAIIPSEADNRALTEGTQHAQPWVRKFSWSLLWYPFTPSQAPATQIERARTNPSMLADSLSSIAWLPSQDARRPLYPLIVESYRSTSSNAIRLACLEALEGFEFEQRQTFDLLATQWNLAEIRPTLIRVLLKVPTSERDPKLCSQLAQILVEYAEATPAAARTEESFLDAMLLADSLFRSIEPQQAKALRKRLDQVTVRIIRLATVEEEMRYDHKYFVVEAGKPVQIVLKNEDLMPHNLVITTPGQLKTVALEAAQMAPDAMTDGKQYVPKSNQVLWATTMVPAHQMTQLTLTAPSEPGEYPYVCTFPNHWMRMYGVMVVVPDLETWNQNPREPADPIGNNRSFVRNWKYNDLEALVEQGIQGRSEAIGSKLLQEATCLQCHKLQQQGGAIGPDLSDVATRWKGNMRSILREIVDPSHKIDPKYAMQNILTDDGRVLSGVIVREDDQTISLVVSAEQKEPTSIAKGEISERARSSKSMMPNGLMDTFTQDEIMEILAYLQKMKGTP